MCVYVQGGGGIIVEMHGNIRCVGGRRGGQVVCVCGVVVGGSG